MIIEKRQISFFLEDTKNSDKTVRKNLNNISVSTNEQDLKSIADKMKSIFSQNVKKYVLVEEKTL